ncbi:unnamed protein product [Miscanthus lutarioriparius]|uniref:Uncharacterized protein n=1 Tax=Miscanthus lutarioriparius TaxID=422564 RepID=A0A811S907_9POAL|nr:unnamed protein product [Miscanthus lutarioriparius]
MGEERGRDRGLVGLDVGPQRRGGWLGFDPWRELRQGEKVEGKEFMRMLPKVRKEEKVESRLTWKLDIVMDDGTVMFCCSAFSVDIHCDDISTSKLLKDWAYHMFCKIIDGEGRISFLTLLVHLKKKLQLQLTEEELRLNSMSVIDGEEENEDILEMRRKQQEWVPPKPKPKLAEVELHDCTLFPILWES